MLPIDGEIIIDDPGGEFPEIPGSLPGLAQFLRPRYSSNLAISEELPLVDVLYDIIFPSCRGFMTMGANGKIRFHNKKPVDNALGLEAFSSVSNVLNVDDVSPWIIDLWGHLLIDPHTNDSEVRDVIAANYPTSQNSVTLTTNEATDIVITGFSGCDGDSIPATAEIQIASFTPDDTYEVTLDGTLVSFIPTAGDTEEGLASFLAGAFKGHPGVNRRFSFDWQPGDDFLTITAKFGTLTIDSPLENVHVTPVANPSAAPTLTETASGDLPAGVYRVAYSFRNEHGQTMLSPYKEITIAANKKITVTAVTPPTGCTVVWYTVPEAGSTKLRYHSENDGASFVIDHPLPLKSAPLPPDHNRTGTEVMRVAMVFSDREVTRSAATRANVHKDSYEWNIGRRQKRHNQVKLKYREASQDWRLIELRLRDDANIAKIKKTEPLEVNGQAIDNGFQAYRIAAGLLAEEIEGNFFYEWIGSRRAALLEEGDVVCITDDGKGVFNLPVMIEDISPSCPNAGMVFYKFTGRKFANTLYDDSVNEITIPVVSEHVREWPEPPTPEPEPETDYLQFSGDNVTFLGDDLTFSP